MTRLRQRMLEDMGIRNLADNTQSAYLHQIIAYAKHFHRPPEDLGPEVSVPKSRLEMKRPDLASSLSFW